LGSHGRLFIQHPNAKKTLVRHKSPHFPSSYLKNKLFEEPFTGNNLI